MCCISLLNFSIYLLRCWRLGSLRCCLLWNSQMLSLVICSITHFRSWVPGLQLPGTWTQFQFLSKWGKTKMQWHVHAQLPNMFHQLRFFTYIVFTGFIISNMYTSNPPSTKSCQLAEGLQQSSVSLLGSWFCCCQFVGGGAFPKLSWYPVPATNQ